MSDQADILERFRRGAELLAMVTTGAAGTELDYKPSDDKWSVRQIVCHLSDSEAVLVMRLRLVLAEDNPTMNAFDQDAWAKNLDYGRRKISQALETFRRLRTENYELVKDLPEPAFARTGMHVERGITSLLDLIRYNAGHVENHVKQIQGVRAAYREHRAKQTV
ncbi:MAG TPA: DinB family protein [Bryobacteraceae bacterium]